MDALAPEINSRMERTGLQGGSNKRIVLRVRGSRQASAKHGGVGLVWGILSLIALRLSVLALAR